MYKIVNVKGYESIQIKNTNTSIHGRTGSLYQQFIKDVAEQGYDIVEGPDVVQPSYAELRKAEYPPIEDQLDKIYHSGVNAWKAQIKQIKDRHPKSITGRTDIAPLPDWVTTAVENYRFNQQLRAYVDAVERLDQRILTETQERLVDEVLVGTVYETVVIQEYIEAIPADDPRVIQDEAERAEAQAVIDATPQNVIDAINN
jgi:uncharacterized protein (UPF0335 family)